MSYVGMIPQFKARAEEAINIMREIAMATDDDDLREEFFACVKQREEELAETMRSIQ